jgi:hypothetical protein
MSHEDDVISTADLALPLSFLRSRCHVGGFKAALVCTLAFVNSWLLLLRLAQACLGCSRFGTHHLKHSLQTISAYQEINKVA